MKLDVGHHVHYDLKKTRKHIETLRSCNKKKKKKKNMIDRQKKVHNDLQAKEHRITM